MPYLAEQTPLHLSGRCRAGAGSQGPHMRASAASGMWYSKCPGMAGAMLAHLQCKSALPLRACETLRAHRQGPPKYLTGCCCHGIVLEPASHAPGSRWRVAVWRWLLQGSGWSLKDSPCPADPTAADVSRQSNACSMVLDPLMMHNALAG